MSVSSAKSQESREYENDSKNRFPVFCILYCIAYSLSLMPYDNDNDKLIAIAIAYGLQL